MFRKAWNVICDTLGFSERNQLKRSLPNNSNTSEEDLRSPLKRRRLDADGPMISSQHLFAEIKHFGPERRKEAKHQFRNSSSFMQSSEFISNKENAFGDFHRPSEAKESNEHPIIIDAADASVRIIRGNPATLTPATEWVHSVPKSNGSRRRVSRLRMDDDDEVQAVYQSPAKSRGATPRFPMANRPPQGRMHKMFTAQSRKPAINAPSDDELQVLEPVLKRPAAMQFSSNPRSALWSYRVGSGSGSLFKPSTSTSSNTSRRNSSSLGRPALDYCEQRQEKVRFQQLIAKVTGGIRWGSRKTANRNKAATEACQQMRNIPVVTIDADVDTREIVETNRFTEYTPTTLATTIAEHGFGAKRRSTPSGANSVDKLLQSKYFEDVNLVKHKYDLRDTEIREQLKEPQMRAKVYAEQNDKNHKTIEERMREYCRVTEVTLKEVVAEPQLPELTLEMEARIRAALVGYPGNQLLVEAFSLRITRTDMQTLNGLNWLNDEVINLYMNLLIERGKEPGFPKVYAFNTFFYPRLLSGGHAALKRWTRKIDLFSYDIIIVPVHLGVHWCMASVDFRSKKISYFDSMGKPNNKCLKQLSTYLEEESKDKRKCPWDSKGWILENRDKIPQQMNGSDCGMFACMYSEYICRDASITFTQDDMPYFRRKMCFELLTAKLLPFK